MLDPAALQSWAQSVIREQTAAAASAIASYCEKPRSAERVHRARKGLARLRAALADLAQPAGATAEFVDRIYRLHRRAGKVRDADVLIARVDEYLESAGILEQEELHAIRAALKAKRKRARRKLARCIRALPELGQ